MEQIDINEINEKTRWKYHHQNKNLKEDLYYKDSLINSLKNENTYLKNQNEYFKQLLKKDIEKLNITFKDNTIYYGFINIINKNKSFGFIKCNNHNYYFNSNSIEICFNNLEYNKKYSFKLIKSENSKYKYQAYILNTDISNKQKELYKLMHKQLLELSIAYQEHKNNWLKKNVYEEYYSIP